MTFMSGHPGGRRQKRRPGLPGHPGQMTPDQAHQKMAGRAKGGSTGQHADFAGGSKSAALGKDPNNAQYGRLIAKLSEHAQKKKRLGR